MYKLDRTQCLDSLLPTETVNEVAKRIRDEQNRHVTLASTISLRDRALLSTLKALRLTTRDGGSGATVRILRLVIAAHLLHTQGIDTNLERPSSTQVKLSKRQLRQVQQYIQFNLSGDIRIEDLARQVGVSRTRFLRRFKASMGKTPHKFIMESRIQHAKSLLRNTCLNIADVAARSGFAHASHLSQTFRQLHKVSPSAYRAQVSSRWAADM